MDNCNQNQMLFVGGWIDFASCFPDVAYQYIARNQQDKNLIKGMFDYQKAIIFYCPPISCHALKISDYQQMLHSKTMILLIVGSHVKIHIYDDMQIERSIMHLVLYEGASCLYEHDFSARGVDVMERALSVTAYNNAVFDYYTLYSGESSIKHSYYSDARGHGVRLSLRGIFCATGNQAINLDTFQQHTYAHAESNVLLKGFVSDKASVSYKGTITIDKNAVNTIARQEHKTLLLHDRASVVSVPILEVLNKDVQCSHASAIGRLDEQSLFYLHSRGFNPREAQRIFILSFIESVYPLEKNLLHLNKKLSSIVNNSLFL